MEIPHLTQGVEATTVENFDLVHTLLELDEYQTRLVLTFVKTLFTEGTKARNLKGVANGQRKQKRI